MKIPGSVYYIAILSLIMSCENVNKDELELKQNLKMGKYKAASDLILNEEKRDFSPTDVLITARHFSEKTDYAKSSEIIEKLVQIDSSNVAARLLLANNLRATQEDDNRALSIYSEMAEVDSIRFIVLPERARLYIRLHEFDKARADIDEAKRLQPKYFAVYLAEGLLEYAQGDAQRALDLLEEAEKYDPGFSAEAALYSGFILLKDNLNYQALGEFSRAIDVRKFINVGYAFINRGVCQINLQDTAFACQDWDSASHYLPEKAATYLEKYCK